LLHVSGAAGRIRGGSVSVRNLFVFRRWAVLRYRKKSGRRLKAACCALTVRSWDGTAGQTGESRLMREWRRPVETSHSYQLSVARTIHLAEKAGTSGVGRERAVAPGRARVRKPNKSCRWGIKSVNRFELQRKIREASSCVQKGVNPRRGTSDARSARGSSLKSSLRMLAKKPIKYRDHSHLETPRKCLRYPKLLQWLKQS
jgi:hypothetical protein